MIQTAAGGLDVGLPPRRIGALMMVDDGVQAGQAGARGKEDGQQEGRLGLN
jgi:hypothetical protein